jgi:hypothetical protein
MCIHGACVDCQDDATDSPAVIGDGSLGIHSVHGVEMDLLGTGLVAVDLRCQKPGFSGACDSENRDSLYKYSG